MKRARIHAWNVNKVIRELRDQWERGPLLYSEEPPTEAEREAGLLEWLWWRLAEINGLDYQAVRLRMKAELWQALQGRNPETNARMPEPGYLGLIVCEKSKIISREGRSSLPVDLSKKDVRWSIFWPLFKAGRDGLNPDSLKDKHSGEKRSFDANLSNLREDIATLGVLVSKAKRGRYRLLDESEQISE